MTQYKCFTCMKVIVKDDLDEDGNCPICHESVKEMCPNDHCHCPHDVVETIAYCPLCGAPMCPECMTHDVHQLSRITGYISDVSGWNAAKQQELRDRMHVSAEDVVKCKGIE